MKNLISVIIPTRNRPVELSAALASVLTQTYLPVEIIVVDDGSECDISRQLRSLFPATVCWLRHERPLGACAARNYGLQFAHGEYVAFLDDDDRWLPNKLERQILIFNNSVKTVGMVGCGYRYEADGEFLHERVPPLPAIPYDSFLRGNWLGSTSLPLLRRAVLEEVKGFDPELPSCQDWDLWLRVSRVSMITMVYEPLVVRCIHGGQMTGDITRKIDGRICLLKKLSSELAARPAIHAIHLRRLGVLMLVAGRPAEAKKYFIPALGLKPLDIFSLVGLLLAHCPSFLVQSLVRAVSVVRFGKYRLYH